MKTYLDTGDQKATQRWNALSSTRFFFSSDGESAPLVDSYKGASAFLIASGPSFAAIDKSSLRSVWTMTINNAVTSYRGNAAIFVDEPSHFNLSMWLDPTITKFVPAAHFQKPLWDNRLIDGEQKWEPSTLRVKDCPAVFGFCRNEKFTPETFLHESTVNWGNHGELGGGRSVLIAALRVLFLLGFRHVYLLGVDFHMTAGSTYHFDEGKGPAGIRTNNDTYAKMQSWFHQLQPHFLKAGFIVSNCNPGSKLTAFPFVPLETAIANARSIIGAAGKERTRGMYKDFAQKKTELLTPGMHKISLEHLHAVAPHRPPGYSEDVIARGKLEGGILFIEDAAYRELLQKYSAHRQPSILTKAANATGAAARAAKSVAASISRGESPNVLVPREERARRFAICQACEHFTGKTCRLCGCVAKWKTKLATERCPIGKW